MYRQTKHRLPIGKQIHIVPHNNRFGGDGVTDWATDLKDKFILKYLSSRPKILNDLLVKEGNQIIKKIEVCRVPLTSKFNKLLQWASPSGYDKVMKERNYDRLFHLYIIFHLDNGKVYKLEKNQRVNVKDGGIPKKEGVECISIVTPDNIKFADFMLKAEDIPGFYRYNAFKDNCQKWVLDLLHENGINNSDYDEFILQKIDDIAPSYIQSIAQAGTDLAGVIDYNIKGGKKN
jgi:hypothetical protein